MKERVCSLRLFVVFFLFSSFFASLLPSQAPIPAPSSAIARKKLTAPLRRQAIERHFESTRPVARPQLGGALPGNQLIQNHRQRAEALQHRKLATGLASNATVASGTVLPGLETRLSLGAGSYPSAVVTGDFNNDGHMDFAVGNGDDNDIWIYLGNGDGTFQLPRIVPLTKGLSPVNLVAADLRGKGVLDLVVSEFDSSTIGVLLGNGDGTFATEQIYELPEPPGGLTVNDFNHDGKLDIVAAMVTTVEPASLGVPYIAMLAGNGDGTFAAPVITTNWGFYSLAYNLDSADVNGDGLPDLLITGSDLDNSTIYLNNGDGTFKEGQLVVGNGAFNAVVDGRLVDVNGDGCPDAEIADVSGVVWVSLGDCKGDFAAPTLIDTGQANSAVRVADVNGDGHLDLIASSMTIEEPNYQYTAGNTVSVAFGDGKGNFSLAHIYGGNSEAQSLAIADFKGNGRPNIVTADIDTDTATVYPNDGNGGFGFPQGIYACQTSKGTYVCPDVGYAFGSGYTFADLNGDGKPDIFEIGITGPGDYYSLGFLNDGTGRFGASLASPFNASTTITELGDYKLGDFRNTGHLDLVAIGTNTAYTTTQQILVFQPGNGDGSFGNATVTAVSGADGLMATGDFNGDGKLDFVAVNGAQSHILTTFLGNGDGTFRAGAPLTFSDSNNDIARVFTGDYNRDGKLDILVFATSNGYGTSSSAIWEFDGNGDGTFQPGRELFTGFGPMMLADMNNDGHPDIARYDFFEPGTSLTILPTPEFTNYLGQADGTFQQVSQYTPYSNEPLELAPYEQFGDPLTTSIMGDYNGDGKIDEVAFQSQSVLYAQMMMGNGDGTFTPTYDVFPFTPYVYPVYGHDLNGDGFTDMLSLDWGSGGMMIEPGAPAPALQMVLENPEVTGTQGCGLVFPDLISTSTQSVTLWSSVAGVSLPASVTIPANAASAEFCYTLASNFDVRQVFDINASLNGTTATAYGSLVNNLGFSESLSSSTSTPVYAGQSTPPITVTLTAQPGYTGTLNLSCDGVPTGYGCKLTPDQLSIAPGEPASASLVVSTASGNNASTSTVTVVANDGTSIQRQTLSVPVANLAIQGLNTIYTESGSAASGSFGIFGIPPYTLSCSGLPPGASCSFNITQEAYPTLSPVTFTLTTASGTAAANYPLQIVANSGGQSGSATATLDLFAFSLQAPAASSDWTTPNSSPTVTFPVQVSSNLPSGGLQIGCTLDSSPVCQTLTMGLNATTTSVFVTPSIPASTTTGQHQLNVTTIFYGVTQNFSFPYTIVDFSGSLSTSSVSMKAGASATLTATLSATTGFSDLVTLTCSAPVQIACTLPASTQLSGAGPQTVSITLTAQSTAAMRQREGYPQHFLPGNGPLALAGSFPILIGLILRRRRFRTFLELAVCVWVLCLVASCGSGGGGGGGGGGNSATYTVSVSAAASGTSDTHSLGSVTVTVSQ